MASISSRMIGGDALHDAPAGRQVDVDAGRELAHEAGADHELVAHGLRAGRIFFDGGQQQLTGAHGTSRCLGWRTGPYATIRPMRILFVLPELPHPPFTADHARPLTLLRAAVRSHEVAVAGAAPDDADLGPIEELCTEVRVAPAGGVTPARRKTLAAGRGLVSPVPLVSAGRLPVWRRWSRR